MSYLKSRFRCYFYYNALLKIKFSGGEYVSDDDKVFEDSFIGQKIEALEPFRIRLEPFSGCMNHVWITCSIRSRIFLLVAIAFDILAQH